MSWDHKACQGNSGSPARSSRNSSAVAGHDYYMGGKQLGFGDYELTTAKKPTKRDRFLAQMEAVVPWTRSSILSCLTTPKQAARGPSRRVDPDHLRLNPTASVAIPTTWVHLTGVLIDAGTVAAECDGFSAVALGHHAPSKQRIIDTRTTAATKRERIYPYNERVNNAHNASMDKKR